MVYSSFKTEEIRAKLTVYMAACEWDLSTEHGTWDQPCTIMYALIIHFIDAILSPDQNVNRIKIQLSFKNSLQYMSKTFYYILIISSYIGHKIKNYGDTKK